MGTTPIYNAMEDVADIPEQPMTGLEVRELQRYAGFHEEGKLHTRLWPNSSRPSRSKGKSETNSVAELKER